MVVCAAVIAISFAFAVIPSPPITLTVAEPPRVIEPPPVNPVPNVPGMCRVTCAHCHDSFLVCTLFYLIEFFYLDGMFLN